MLAPLALLVAYEAGYALFRRVGPAVAVVCAQVALTALAPAHGGAYTALGLPATASRQLLVPARARARVRLRASGRRAACSPRPPPPGSSSPSIHPTYAIFLWLPFAGFLVVRSLVARRRGEADRGGARRARRPRGRLPRLAPARRSATRPRTRPARTSWSARSAQYAGQLDVFSETSYRLAPEVFGRAGAVAVAALALRPARRARAAPALGGLRARRLPRRRGGDARAAALRRRSPTSSRSRSRAAPRASGRWRSPSRAASPCSRRSCAGSCCRSRSWRASCSSSPTRATSATGSSDGGPALVTLVRRRRRRRRARRRPPGRRHSSIERRGPKLVGAAAALVRAPGRRPRRRELEPVGRAPPEPADAGAGRGAARATCPKAAVVYSDLETSYRIAAYAPVYVAAAPPSHVADTEENRPYERRDDVRALLRDRRPRRSRAGPAPTGSSSIASRFELDAAGGQRLPRRPLHALPSVSPSPLVGENASKYANLMRMGRGERVAARGRASGRSCAVVAAAVTGPSASSAG